MLDWDWQAFNGGCQQKPTTTLEVFTTALVGWPGRHINVRHYEELSLVLLQLKDHSELVAKRRKFLPSSGITHAMISRKLLKST